MTPLFAGFHHAFLADLLGLPPRTIRSIYRSAGLMMCGLILYTMIAASEASFPLNAPKNLLAVIVCFLYSIIRWLKLSRLRHCFAFSSSPFCARSAGSYTNSSSAHTRPLPWQPLYGLAPPPIRQTLPPLLSLHLHSDPRSPVSRAGRGRHHPKRGLPAPSRACDHQPRRGRSQDAAPPHLAVKC
jgi:hypothetical protein